MGAKNYEDLIVWNKAMDFVEAVYVASSTFPSDERYSLTAQLRRSAVSVPSNIAEGEGRFSRADFKRFLSIAHGSLREAETQLRIANRLGYLDTVQLHATLELAGETGRLIRGLSRSLDNT
jgi:four helix bundle protein